MKVRLIVFTSSILLFTLLNFTPVSYIFISVIDIIYKITGWYLMIEIDSLFFLILASIPVIGLFYNSARLCYKRNKFVLDLIMIFCSALVIFAIGLLLQGILGQNSNPLIPQSLKAGLFPFYSHFTLLLGMLLPFLLRPINSNLKSD